VHLSLTWLLWYLVSIEVGGKGYSLLTPKTRVRGVADVLAVAFGIMVGAAGLDLPSYFLPVYARLVAAPYLIWGVAMVSFYGHDLWSSFRGKHLAHRT
jgi:hypothetical protein